ncbi:MAG: hypothetical protein IJ584_17430 [Bacteroidales bacterium]|nr:hypothetical protein [Bacteroidales bacterium]
MTRKEILQFGIDTVRKVFHAHEQKTAETAAHPDREILVDKPAWIVLENSGRLFLYTGTPVHDKTTGRWVSKGPKYLLPKRFGEKVTKNRPLPVHLKISER